MITLARNWKSPSPVDSVTMLSEHRSLPHFLFLYLLIFQSVYIFIGCFQKDTALFRTHLTEKIIQNISTNEIVSANWKQVDVISKEMLNINNGAFSKSREKYQRYYHMVVIGNSLGVQLLRICYGMTVINRLIFLKKLIYFYFFLNFCIKDLSWETSSFEEKIITKKM